ncbi:MAG: DUF1570 domain-containing protein [Candidatus Brocadiia bacterium]
MSMRTHLSPWLAALALVGLAGGPAAASSRKYPVTRGEDCPYRVSTPHFDVQFSVSPRIGQGYGGLCEKAYGKFCTIFQVDEEKDVVWEGKCHVYLFQNRDEFRDFATNVHKSGTGAMSGGYTRITKQDPDIVLFLHEEDHVKLQQTLIHEMTHVFLQLFEREVAIPLWIHEGFAQYFEFQHYAPKSRMKMARRVIKRMVKSERYVPLSRFWVARFPPTDLGSYSQAWSLIEFMASSKSSRRKTGDFVRRIKEKGSPGTEIKSSEDLEKAAMEAQEHLLKLQQDAMEDIFGVDMAQFEALWKRYVLAKY